MRAAVLALLLANVLFFGWAEWIDVPASVPDSIAGLPRLKLAREAAPAPHSGATDRDAALETPAPPPPQCVSIGPFDDAIAANKAAAMLRAKNFAPEQRIAQAAALRRFWVYLGDVKSGAQLARILERLERKGVDNAEAMPAEQGVRRISLGLFSNRARAQLRAGALRAMGFAPKVTERTLPGTVFWLDVVLESGASALPPQGLEPMTGDSQIGVRACPAAAEPGSTAPVPAAPSGPPSTPPGRPPPRSSDPATAGPPVP